MFRIISTICFALLIAQANAAPTIQSFDGAADDAPYTASNFGRSRDLAPVDGVMVLVKAAAESNAIAFDRTAAGTYKRISAQWRFSITSGREGAGIMLLNTAHYGETGDAPDIGWEEPNLDGSFGLGIDIANPDDYTNLDRAHEISLHWDGVERANKRTSFDFRDAGFLQFLLDIEFSLGGAFVNLRIDDEVVYDNYFVAGMAPYESRAAFGARSTTTSRPQMQLDDVYVSFEEPAPQFESPLVAGTFNQEYIYSSNRQPSRSFDLPDEGLVYERVLLRMTLEAPEGGYDFWDRIMKISVRSDVRKTVEIARFMTPYRKGGVWWWDVTDYQSILRGSTRMTAFIDTWVGPGHAQGAGWLVTLDLFYYQGNPKWEPYFVENVWNGEPRYGDPNNPISKFFADKTLDADAEMERAKLRIIVTGHGQSPNTNNAAEFLVRGRTVRVNGAEYYNELWRDDCYMSPCRPQSGTWIYSRAGWCPGDVVAPWDINISDEIEAGASYQLEYEADPYTNNNIVDGNPARHLTASHVIYYRPAQDASLRDWMMYEPGK
ncbi:MAG: peptide-N-glycosidase F-related protein [Candidatus Hinthialibacter antarcticus]|nr:peptide-N-glycosidase F-related protein [Candidatus Hinthialibacter antarcticus]